MAELLRALYEKNESSEEAKSAVSFHDKYIDNEDKEDLFYEAIRDTWEIAFREGVKAALQLYVEIHGEQSR